MTQGRLAGKVALITGGARGMGAAEAALFASEGARVVITDVRDEDGALTAKNISPDASACVYMHHDVVSEDEWATVVASTVETFGRIDVLVNNAGIFETGTVLNTTLDMYRRTIDINLVGVFLGMKAVAEHMVKQQSGSIINISSIAGLQGAAGFLAYGASKWAVRGMSRGVAKELAPFGVRVNSIHPGIIDTAMLQTFDNVGSGVREAVRTRIPMGREAEAQEVATMALFLASDESSYCNGGEFVVDGGWTA
ncbi:MAG: SDR family NAD(P)-dependent oxidoreductase [Actinomycetota bacterium]